MTYDAVKVPVVSPRSRAVIEAEARRLLAATAPECLRSPSPTPMVTIFDMELRKRFDFVAHVADLAPGLEGITDCVEREVILPRISTRAWKTATGGVDSRLPTKLDTSFFTQMNSPAELAQSSSMGGMSFSLDEARSSRTEIRNGRPMPSRLASSCPRKWFENLLHRLDDTFSPTAS